MLIEDILDLDRVSADHAVVVNPGQGYVALAIAAAMQPRTIDLVDRDLLALRYARRNLIANGFPAGDILLMHQVGLAELPSRPAGLIAGVLREDEGQAALNQTLGRMAASLAPRGTIAIASSSTTISRLVTVLQAQKQLTIERRRRRGGNSVLILQSQR
jgi:methylase of polypeptide subunit release factors